MYPLSKRRKGRRYLPFQNVPALSVYCTSMSRVVRARNYIFGELRSSPKGLRSVAVRKLLYMVAQMLSRRVRVHHNYLVGGPSCFHLSASRPNAQYVLEMSEKPTAGLQRNSQDRVS